MKNSEILNSYVLSNGMRYIVYTESPYENRMTVEEFLTLANKHSSPIKHIKADSARRHYRSYMKQGYKLFKTFEAVDA
tara:strand:- start:317 stop:550 length:234 start_codon:yes stop_codon:yes gene_type:complete